jgi:glycerophosphoryl diester phosphodiesterase
MHPKTHWQRSDLPGNWVVTVPCYYLSSSKEDVLTRIPGIQKAKLDGVDLSSKIIDQQVVNELRKAKIEIWCWTVDTPDETFRMKEMGVNVITTNRPTWLKEQTVTN